jgi:hypothetical protein
MYKDKETKKNVKNILLSMCAVSVFDIYFTEYGPALTAVLPTLFTRWIAVVMFVGIVILNSLVAVLLFLGKKKSRMVFFVTNLAIAGNVIFIFIIYKRV